ncbi:MAG: DUF1934 domain-containing protein [Peptostreptococcus sp.]|uniref:DUF1934 domain-containing protein n=1 Tax=Peptostreptococcus sp. TaxID=1262 RepID=UPI002FC804D6
MEGRDVKIKVRTSQFIENGEENTVESFYKGKRVEKNGSIYINFQEFDTVKDSKSIIKIGEDEVIIFKSGEVISKMRFREDKKHKSDYKTPYGDFNMSVYTYKISKKIEEEQLKLNLDYKVSIEGLMDANNRVEIKVTSE